MRASIRDRLLSILGALLFVAGCGGEDTGGGGKDTSGGGKDIGGGGCVPGETVSCACADGTMSTQLCSDSGTGLGPCQCGGGTATGSGATPGAGATTGATGGLAAGGVSGGTAGVAGTGGVGGTTGGTGAVPATGGAPTGGTGHGTCCPTGDCLCRGPAPTEQSATANGPYNVGTYTDGFRDGPFFLAGTIYHPTDAEPPLAGVVICPGWTAVQSSIAAWGPFLASHGIVTMTIDTNTTGDSVAQRADALMDALESLRAENGRPGSPLQGILSPDRYGLMGWSMGGGATWMDTAQHPELKTGIALAGHHATAGGATIAAGMLVPSMMFAGATDSPILGGGGQSQAVYDIIPPTTPKIIYEMAAEGHFSWGTPLQTNGGALGRYGLAFQKVFLEGDERYRPLLLVPGPGASDWRSTVQ